MNKKWSRMNFLQMLQSRKSFFGMVALITVSTVTVVLLLSALLYNTSRQIEIQRSRESAVSAFDQIRTVVESMQTDARAMGLQVMSDEVCSDLLTATRYEYLNSIMTGRMSRQLTMYAYIYPYIDSVFIYNRHAGVMATSSKLYRLSEEEFPDTDILEAINSFDALRGNMPLPRTQRAGQLGSALEESVYTFIFPWFSSTSALDCAVVVNLSQDWFSERLQALPAMDKSWVRVSKEDGTLLVDYNAGSFFVWDDSTLQDELVYSPAPCLTEYQQGENRYLLVSQMAGGLKYTKVIEWDAAFPGVLSIKKATGGIIGLVLCGVLILCVLNALSAHRVYSRLEKRNRELVHSGRVHLRHSRDSFLFDLIEGYSSLKHSQVDRKMQEYELPYTGKQPVTLLALKIERYQKQISEQGHDNTYVYKYGIGNIFEEIASPYCDCTCVQTGDAYIYFLIGERKETPFEADVMSVMLTEFKSKVAGFVKWPFFIVSTARWATLIELGTLKEDISRCLQDSFFFPSFYHYTTEQASERRKSTMEYPDDTEKHLLDALRLGNLKEAQKQYERFEEAVRSCRYTDCVMAFSLLAFQINNIALEVSDGLQNPVDDGAFLFALRQTSKLEDVEKLFLELFITTLEIAEQAQNKQSNTRRLQEIDAYVRENYSDPALTPNSLAERFHLSSAYLGKLYKKAKRISLAEHINAVRISQSAKKLADTDTPARDIAIECGFTNTNYYYTLFKKTYGLTPQTYRVRTRNAKTEE